MIYISPENEYPRYLGDVMLAKPSFIEGETLPEGWRAVTETNSPEHVEGKVIELGEPTEIDGVLTQTWVYRDLTAEEIERRDAPITAKAKLIALGLTEIEIQALGLRF
jgi:hypothetical protein